MAMRIFILVALTAAGLTAQQPDLAYWTCYPSCSDSYGGYGDWQIWLNVGGECTNSRIVVSGQTVSSTGCSGWTNGSIVGGGYQGYGSFAGYVRADSSYTSNYGYYTNYEEEDCNGAHAGGGTFYPPC
jgi:hypothetical protein